MLTIGREVRGFLFDCHIGKIQQVLCSCGLAVLLYAPCHFAVRVDVHKLQLASSLGLLPAPLFPLLDLCHLSLDFLLVEFQPVLRL